MEKRERVVTASVYDESQSYYEESLKELNALVEVAGGDVIASIDQKVRAYNPATLMGKGKLDELRDFVRAEDIDLVIFDQALSGIQMREIEKTLDTLNVAFEKLLDSLFEDTAWDVATDISVLHTMLAQEGLTESGMKAKD